MAVNNTLTINYGSDAEPFSVGGSKDDYQINGPYVIDKSFSSFRLVFDVVVVGTSTSNLFTKSNALEDAFSKREQNLSIQMGSDTWTYSEGTQILNLSSSISKSGSSDTDRGNSRAYTIVIEGDMPSEQAGGGLRDIEFTVDYDVSRKIVISMTGTYTRTSTPNRSASENYLHEDDGADSAGTDFINGIKTQNRNGSSTDLSFELVDEQYSFNRPDHLCQFTRQYSEVLTNQSTATLDHEKIKDHRVTFSDISQHSGQSRKEITQFNRVSASYESGVDIEIATDLQDLVDTIVKPYLSELFNDNFKPSVFAVEDSRSSYDETTKRLSLAMQFVFAAKGQSEGTVLEVSESVAYREQRTLDHTPIHGKDEFAAEVSVGWATLERISARTMMVMGGDRTPARRLGGGPEPKGKIETKEPYKMLVANDGNMSSTVQKNGWNIVASTSQVSSQWIGDPDHGGQIEVQVLTENVVERYNSAPKGTKGDGGIITTPNSFIGPLTGRR